MALTTVSQLVKSFMSGLEQGEAVCKATAKVGRLDLLQCAGLYGCPWTDSLYSKAAEGGHVNVMAWARTYGCALDKETSNVAARAGYFKALQWLSANSFAGTEKRIIRLRMEDILPFYCG